MSIADAVTWPEHVRIVFEHCLSWYPGPENRYGPINRLMYYCLCESFPCMVMRRTIDPPSPDRNPGWGPILFFDAVDLKRHTFIMFQVEDPEWTQKAELRLRADQQIRMGFDAILSNCTNPHLWGLSLLGSSLRIYSGDVATKTIDPPLPSPPPPSVDGALPSDYLEGAWDLDILSQEGFNKMKGIVQDLAKYLPPKPPNW